jgi:hypothetical protein
MDNDFADRFIAMMERQEKNPPPPNTHEIRWGDPAKFMESLRKEYSDEK